MTKSWRIEKFISCLSILCFVLGCSSSRVPMALESRPQPTTNKEVANDGKVRPRAARSAGANHAGQALLSRLESGGSDLNGSPIQVMSNEQPAPELSADSAQSELPAPQESDNPAAGRDPLELEAVINSVIESYPLLRSAMLGRNIAQGDLLAANGEFDLKLKGDTLNMPVGNYENYRQFVGAEQPLYAGGSVFGGYRLGTGNFPIYYGERATNLGGEFKAGVLLPLAQNHTIDDRRAGLWRNQWEVQGVEPEIQAQLIEFIRVASITYWNWLAAGQNVQIAEDLLKNATERNDGLRIRVQKGDAPAIELTDNERLIVSRRTKLIDAQRKFRQSAVKLSLFLRDESGEPVVIDQSRLPLEFPEATDPSPRDLDTDIQSAIANRPELRALAIFSEQLNIDLAAANNLFLPQIDVVLATSQDVGSPADPKKNDKSQLELEGGLVASVPLQRRKARGKFNAVEAKLAQVRAKTGFTQNKIVAEVQSTSAALNAAFQQLAQAHRSLDLARQMEAAERRKFDLGDSNLLLVNIREQATADAASTEVDARLNYFDAQADYRAVLATDVVP